MKIVFRAIENLSKHVIEYTDTKSKVLYVLNTIARAMEYFMDGLSTLIDGHLSPDLVHPDMLQGALVKVITLRSRDPQLILVHKEMEFYNTSHERMFNTLYVHISAPISSEPPIFTEYETQTFPVPLQAADVSAVDYSMLKSVSPFFAVEPGNNEYIEMSAQGMANCEQG